MMHRALITGSARGIGAAIARRLAQDGWDIALHYHRSRAEALALAEELHCSAYAADIGDSAAVSALAEAVGPVELLVCNAGLAHYGLLTALSDAEWRQLFAVNVDGPFYCARAFLPPMIREKRGCIINISSVWGIHGASCEAAYSATKAAVIGLTRALAKEVGPSGVRVNCVAPGVIETDMLAPLSAADRTALAEDTPLCRLGTPAEVAEAVAFLASERAAFIIGQVLGVDGGFAL